MANALSRLFLPSQERWALGRWASWLSPWEADDGGDSLAGVSLTRETAAAIAAVYACVRVLTGTIASLPIDTLERQGRMRMRVDRPVWLDRPEPANPNLTRIVHFSQVVSSMLWDGNAFTLALPSVYEPARLIALDPRRVRVKRQPDQSVIYEVRGNDGSAQNLGPERILHTPLPVFIGDSTVGLSPIEAARQGLALSLAADRYGAKFFEKGAMLSGVVQVPGPLSQQDQDAVRDRWKERYGGVKNAGEIGVLTQGAEWKPLGISMEQAQFIEVRRYQAEEIARLYGVPPSIVGITVPGAVSYASVEQQNLQFVTYTIRNIVETIEASYQRLIPGDETFIKFNLRGLLRGDSTARATFYREMSNIRALVPDEIRALEDFPPIAGGRQPIAQLNTASASAADASTQANAYKTLTDAGYPPDLAAQVTGLPVPPPEPPPPPPAPAGQMPMAPGQMPQGAPTDA